MIGYVHSSLPVVFRFFLYKAEESSFPELLYAVPLQKGADSRHILLYSHNLFSLEFNCCIYILDVFVCKLLDLVFQFFDLVLGYILFLFSVFCMHRWHHDGYFLQQP